MHAVARSSAKNMHIIKKIKSGYKFMSKERCLSSSAVIRKDAIPNCWCPGIFDVQLQDELLVRNGMHQINLGMTIAALLNPLESTMLLILCLDVPMISFNQVV
jgi:hypothetical protein